ncbi:MAG TPA: MipA/OmpV family protein [Kiritimatiellia bacterium]|nr:MipA/OmpV family protein [Kiritimatiellia bacterium]
MKLWTFIRGLVAVIVGGWTLGNVSEARGETRSLEIVIRGIESFEGQIMVAVFEGREGFENPRFPLRRATVAPTGSTVSVWMHDLPAGDVAVSVFHDVNSNARLDANALGVPREPTGFSNTPEARMGRPDFDEVRVDLRGADRATDVELRLPRLASARWGVGVGLVASRSPYKGGKGVGIPIPVINYYGDRFFVAGIRAGYALVRWPGLSLSAVGQYSFAGSVFDESEFLKDMDRKRNTVLAGLALSRQGARGYTTQLEWKTDVLGVHNGNLVDLSIGRRYRFGKVGITPSLGLSWRSERYTDYFYGVKERFAREDRPAYDPGSSWVPFAQVSGVWSPAEAWTIIGIARAEFFDETIKDSPLIERDAQTSLIVGVSYSF